MDNNNKNYNEIDAQGRVTNIVETANKPIANTANNTSASSIANATNAAANNSTPTASARAASSNTASTNNANSNATDKPPILTQLPESVIKNQTHRGSRWPFMLIVIGLFAVVAGSIFLISTLF